MTNNQIRIPHEQFKALQMDIADALLHADMAPCGDYHIRHPDGSESLSDDGQEIFNGYYDQAEIILIDGGIEPDG